VAPGQRGHGFAPAFLAKLSDRPVAVGFGVNVPLPGIHLAPMGTTLPSGNTLPQDTDARSDAKAIAAGGSVTISPVQGMAEAGMRFEAWLQRRVDR